jgi:alpha-L-fucosidase 2
LKKAKGENKNQFYQVEDVATPVISPKATITPPELKNTLLYDISTEKGKKYTLISK